MATISNFSMAPLYAKDLNWINYGVLTTFYFYFSKKVEQYLIGGDRVIEKEHEGMDVTAVIRAGWNMLVFEDKIKLKRIKQEALT
jgi:uncharacterized protein YhjY with autotransporter beta-barrel domain